MFRAGCNCTSVIIEGTVTIAGRPVHDRSSAGHEKTAVGIKTITIGGYGQGSAGNFNIKPELPPPPGPLCIICGASPSDGAFPRSKSCGAFPPDGAFSGSKSCDGCISLPFSVSGGICGGSFPSAAPDMLPSSPEFTAALLSSFELAALLSSSPEPASLAPGFMALAPYRRRNLWH